MVTDLARDVFIVLFGDGVVIVIVVDICVLMIVLWPVILFIVIGFLGRSLQPEGPFFGLYMK